MMGKRGADFSTEFNRKQTLDRRRESSRFAARDRRGKEADIFTDLKVVVPIVDEATVTHVDRIALLRIASAVFRLRKIAAKFLKTNLDKERECLWSETTLLECLDGFLAIIDLDGIILYISESVSIYLGLTQTDLTGRSLKDFIHTTDYEEYLNYETGGSADHGCGRISTMRMKSVISPRGRNLNLKSALFKPVVCHMCSLFAENGRVRIIQASAQPAGQGNSIFAASRSTEVQNGIYMTRHTYDMKFSYISESFNYILRHEARSLMGTSFYNLVHPVDLHVVVVSIREVLTKGYTRTPYYRLIGLNKSVLWVQTEATAVNHMTKGQKGQYIICMHHLIGTQSERDSFINGKNSGATLCPASMPIKQEMTESSDPMKSSYNDILQWLFRAQQRSKSPPGTLLFRNQNSKNRTEYSGESARSITRRAETINYGTKNGITVSGTSDCMRGNASNILAYNGNGEEFGPLATEIDRCRLRKNSVRANCGGGAINGNACNCTNHCFQADFSESPTTVFNSVRLSAISATDMIEGTDDWQMFAPFVAHDDMMQLSTDLQGLLPEFTFVDWIPSDPAPLPSLPIEERGMPLLGNVSIPMQMAFDRSNMCSSISLLSKPNTFGFAATSWRQLQQQYQQHHQENMNAGVTTATPRLNVELTATYTRSNDHPTRMFHRNNSTAHIQ
uniref:PAS domain-containing protein n=2 Tax=Onchocerca volvulus TaxID=6282 RepID=A0A8R1TWV5_ONCVO